jgi:hypothetical protein
MATYRRIWQLIYPAQRLLRAVCRLCGSSISYSLSWHASSALINVTIWKFWDRCWLAFTPQNDFTSFRLPCVGLFDQPLAKTNHVNPESIKSSLMFVFHLTFWKKRTKNLELSDFDKILKRINNGPENLHLLMNLAKVYKNMLEKKSTCRCRFLSKRWYILSLPSIIRSRPY